MTQLFMTYLYDWHWHHSLVHGYKLTSCLLALAHVLFCVSAPRVYLPCSVLRQSPKQIMSKLSKGHFDWQTERSQSINTICNLHAEVHTF